MVVKSQLSAGDTLIKSTVRRMVAETVAPMYGIGVNAITANKLRLPQFVAVVMARFDFGMDKKTHDPDFVSQWDKKVDSAFRNLKLLQS